MTVFEIDHLPVDASFLVEVLAFKCDKVTN